MKYQPRFTAENFILMKNLRKKSLTWDDIGDVLNRHPDTCRKSYVRWVEKSKLPPKPKNVKRKITPYISRLIMRILDSNPQTSLSMIQFLLKKEVKNGEFFPSKSGIRKFLLRKNIEQKKLRFAPLISATNRIRRVAFANWMLRNVRFFINI